MKLTISNSCLRPVFGQSTSFQLIKEAGFDGVELFLGESRPADNVCEKLLDDHLGLAQNIRQSLAEYDLICNQAHAPFRKLSYGMAFDCSDPAYLQLVNSLECAAIVGAKQIVVHGITAPFRGKSFQSLQYNFEFFKSLEPYAQKFGILIAIENLIGALPSPDTMATLTEMLDSPCFTVNFDTGHSNLFGVPPECYISDLPRGLITGLHIQDNQGSKDEHMLPGLGTVNWDATLSALAKSNYGGDFNLEVDGFLRCFDDDNIPAALKLCEGVGRSLINKLEQLRSEQ